MDLRAKIGYKLKQLRLDANLSQEKLAELLDVHIQAIGKVETGKIFISEKVLEKACKFFNVKPKYFFDFEELKLRQSDEERINDIVEKLKHSKPIFIKQIHKIVQALYEEKV